MASRLKINKTGLEKEIAKLLEPAIGKYQNAIAPKIEFIVKKNLKIHFDNEDTIQSILGRTNGARFSLKQEFGLTDDLSLDAAINIIDSIVNSVQVEIIYGPVQVGLAGRLFNFITGAKPKNTAKLIVTIAPESFQLELSKRFSYVSENSNIPWLNWLLTQGGRVVVDGFSVGKSGSFKSRAGGVLMRKKGVYRVDPIYSGVIGDNFITRGIQDVFPQIVQEIQAFLSTR